jgi:hypothetical protein
MKTFKEIQQELKKEIPYKWRVQSFSKHKPQATCVAYIDSRDVQDVLDKYCNWSDRYYSVNGMLFCEITIYADGIEYKRSDAGSESNVEAQKGQSSDAFKRAAVKFGIGRFLYSKKMVYLKADAVKTSNNYPNVVDDNGKKVWDITKHINQSANQSANQTTKKTPTNDRQWLTESQLNATLKGTKDQAEKVLISFKMKKDYREQIVNKFNLK